MPIVAVPLERCLEFFMLFYLFIGAVLVTETCRTDGVQIMPFWPNIPIYHPLPSSCAAHRPSFFFFFIRPISFRCAKIMSGMHCTFSIIFSNVCSFFFNFGLAFSVYIKGYFLSPYCWHAICPPLDFTRVAVSVHRKKNA